MKNLITQFEHYVEKTPDAIAISLQNQSFTYAQLNNYANYIAQLLCHRGVKKRSVIAVMGEKSLEMVAGIIGILKLNCSYMPVDSALPFERINIMLENADVDFIISNEIPSINIDDIMHIKLNYELFDSQQHYQNFNVMISAEDPAYIMHTSGSTGKPKGVIVPHRGVIRLLCETNYIQLFSTDSVLFHSNTSFDAGIFEIWAALINGARLVISPHMIGDLPVIFKLCKEEKITVLLLATGLFHIFSNLDVNELTTLRYLVVGGDVMHNSAATRTLTKNPSIKIINGYGPAENCVFTTCHVINHLSDIGNPISIGKEITGTKVYLLDDNQNIVPPGEPGELYTSGLGVALGYINAPQLTAEKFIKLPDVAGDEILYRTGDMVKQHSDGNYEFIGRRDNQVKIRGFRVELSEIESTISGLSFVEDVCLFTIGDDNKKLVAFVKVGEKTIQHEKCNEPFILDYLKNKLPAYCIPSFIKISDELPLTLNGKIDRHKLRYSLEKNN